MTQRQTYNSYTLTHADAKSKKKNRLHTETGGYNIKRREANTNTVSSLLGAILKICLRIWVSDSSFYFVWCRNYSSNVTFNYNLGAPAQEPINCLQHSLFYLYFYFCTWHLVPSDRTHSHSSLKKGWRLSNASDRSPNTDLDLKSQKKHTELTLTNPYWH